MIHYDVGLYDYPQVIKNSMDLGSVKKKIMDRKYKSLQQAAEDVRLVWSNCMTYNADGSDFFILAQGLAKKWEDKFQKLLADLGVEEGGAAPSSTPSGPAGSSAPPMTDATNASSNNNKISVDDKRAFARSLYKISKEDLGKLIVEVDNKCPAALTKNAGEDECELNVDKLTPGLFAELKGFVNSCKSTSTQAATSSGLSKKKSTSSATKRQKT
jgi:hypothetical protein